MTFLQNLSIKSRLIFLVLFGGAFFIATALIGFNGLNNGKEALASMHDSQLVPVTRISEITGLMKENRIQILLALQHDENNPFHKLHDHPASKHLDPINANIQKITVLFQEYLATDLTDDQKALIKEFEQLRNVFVSEGLKPTLAALRNGQYTEANSLVLTQLEPNYAPVAVVVEKLLKMQLDYAQDLQQRSLADYLTIRNASLLLIAISIGLNALLALLTINGISQAVQDLNRTSNQLADGNLLARTHYQGGDELGQVASAFNRMGERFHKIMQQLNGASIQLATAAEETSAISNQTSSSLRQQQSETEQVATAMNEMNATVREVARNAGDASGAAHKADEESAAGKQVVSQTINTISSLAREVENAVSVIRQLEQESDSIGAVLDVIRGIAEQTNLLALNAAIEAARAGEQGRGFAVVADEVRTLASRTQQSTAEIQSMIQRLQAGTGNAVKVMETSSVQAQAGVKQVSQAGASLDSITRAVATITDMNAQIASAAEEQTAVAEEINRNIININQSTEESNQGAQQTATASEELSRLAGQLQAMVGQFKI